MKLIKVGRRWINLEYLIMGEEFDGSPETAHIPPGGVRLTLETGKEFDLSGVDAEKAKRHVCEFFIPDPIEDLVAEDEGPLPGEGRKSK